MISPPGYFEGFPAAPGVMMDIDRARRIIGDRKPNARLCVRVAAKLIRMNHAAVNARHLKSKKITNDPVIMILVAGRRVLIDGWHRAARAHRRRRKYLPAHLLSEGEARRVAMPAHRTRKAK